MTISLGPALPPSPQRGTATGRGSKVRPHRYLDGANGARPACASKYGLFSPAEPAGIPAAAEIQERGEGHKSAMGTGYQDERDTEMGGQNGQHALLARCMPEDADEEQRPPKRQRTLNACNN